MTSAYIIEADPIRVSYGYDQFIGIFLSVYDSRLEFDEDADDEVNEVTEYYGPGDCSGLYLHLHTNDSDFGHTVSKSTMAVYMARYGVPKSHVSALLEDRLIEENE